jgi:RNase P/RNase MRP subunit POP5
MAAIANDKDKILQATAVRLPESPGNYIYFSNVSPVFKVTAGGTTAPANYAVEAKFSGQLRGTVSWSVVSGTVSAAGQSGNTWNISAGDLTSNTAVIRATLVYLGTTYSNEFTISKVFDGVAGVDGVTATLVRLTGTEIVFIKFKDGSFSSNTVTIFANTQNIPTPVFTWNDGINPPVVKDSTLIAGANQFQFNRPAELGVYTISVSVSDKNNLALGTAVDSTSIAFIEEGSDAFTFAFKELADQFSANSLGVLEGGVTSALNHIIGIKGIALLVPGVDIVYSVHSTENCTATLGAVTGTWNQQFTVSGAFFTQASVTTAKVTIKCQVPGSVFYLMTASYVKVRKGDTGITGTNTATIALYAKNTSASTAPAAFSGTFTYTFSTSTLSGGTLNGWSTTAPNVTNGEYLWVRYAVAASNTATDTVASSEFSGAVVNSVGGVNGAAGTNTATIALYAKNTSASTAPAAFSGTFTYTFSTSTLSGGTLNGWSRNAPAITNGEYLWVRYAVAASNTATDTVASTEFSAAVVNSVGGVNGVAGTNTATIALYAKNTSASTAPAAFSGTFTYTFSTSTISGGTLNGWSTTAPNVTNGEYLWVRYAVAASNTATDTVDSSEFSGAVVNSVGGVNGAAGTNTATIALYAKNTSASTAPAAFSGTFTYTFSTSTLSGGTLNGWSRNAPAITNGEYLWVRYAVAASNTATDTVASTEFSAAVVNSIGGTNGTAGTNAVKSTSGYIYYSVAGISAPQPSASSFNFSTGLFTSLSPGWGTTVNMTGNGSYWAARYVVTESAFGSNTGTPTFSAPFNHQNFEGLVTFTNLATSGQTSISGGNITSDTLNIDSIKVGTTKSTVSGLTFGFGEGTTLYNIATAGFFRSTSSTAAALAVSATQNIAFSAGSASRTTALFSNTLGSDSVNARDVITGAAIGQNTIVQTSPGVFSGWSQAGFFQRRRDKQGTASEQDPDTYTAAYARIAYLQGGDTNTYAAKFMTTTTSGADVRGVVIGGPSYGITITGGGAGYFTGCHDGMLPNTMTAEPGDILVDTEIIVAKSISDTLTKVALSTQPNQKGVLGVYVNTDVEVPVLLSKSITENVEEYGHTITVTKQVLDSQYQQIVDTHEHVIINALGEGSINVCGENGTIELGDLIVTSSVPGKGMRQSDDIVRSTTVAKARETVVFDSPTQVKQIACIYMCG